MSCAARDQMKILDYEYAYFPLKLKRKQLAAEAVSIWYGIPVTEASMAVDYMTLLAGWTSAGSNRFYLKATQGPDETGRLKDLRVASRAYDAWSHQGFTNLPPAYAFLGHRVVKALPSPYLDGWKPDVTPLQDYRGREIYTAIVDNFTGFLGRSKTDKFFTRGPATHAYAGIQRIVHVAHHVPIEVWDTFSKVGKA